MASDGQHLLTPGVQKTGALLLTKPLDALAYINELPVGCGGRSYDAIHVGREHAIEEDCRLLHSVAHSSEIIDLLLILAQSGWPRHAVLTEELVVLVLVNRIRLPAFRFLGHIAERPFMFWPKEAFDVEQGVVLPEPCQDLIQENVVCLVTILLAFLFYMLFCLILLFLVLFMYVYFC